jgi:hypothetical protein
VLCGRRPLARALGVDDGHQDFEFLPKVEHLLTDVADCWDGP